MIPKLQKSTWFDLGLLTVLTMVVTFLNYLWVLEETRPPHWDMGRHLWTSLLYLDLLKDPGHLYRLWTNYYYYPPLRYWMTLPFYLLFGKSLAVAINSNWVFLSILVFSMYGIGRELWGRATGLLSALFILASPFYVMQFKEYQLDAPLGAMCALSLYLLLKAEGFSNKKYSYWLGLSLGLGMLTKWTFCLCLAFPLAYILFKGWRRGERSNILKSCAIALGVSLIWYANHPRMLKNDFFPNSFGSGDAPWWSLDAQLYYWGLLGSAQLFLIPFLMFLAGLGLSLAVRKYRERNLVPVLFTAGNYFLFTLIHRDPRYTMPMLVGVSLLAVFWVGEIKPRWMRTAATVSAALYCAFAFWAVSFGTGLIPKDVGLGRHIVFAQHGYLIGPPTHEEWHQEEVVRMIAGQPSGEKDMTFRGLDTMYFNSWGLYYFSRKYRVDFQQAADRTTYLLLREMKEPAVPRGYKRIKRFDLPDSSVLELLERQPR